MKGIQRIGKSLSFFLFMALVFGNPSIFALAGEHGPPGGGGGEPPWVITYPGSLDIFPANLPSLGVTGTGIKDIAGIIEARDNNNNVVSNASFTVSAAGHWNVNLDKPEGENWPLSVAIILLIDEDGDGKVDDQMDLVSIHFGI